MLKQFHFILREIDESSFVFDNKTGEKNMNRRPFLILIFMITLVTTCYGKVVVDYNKDFNFASIKTYGWMKGTPADALMEQRIVKAVESQLAKHGVQKTDSTPDVFVVTRVLTREDISIRDWGYSPFGWGRDININKYLVGTLVVDILDAKNEQLVWRGIADGTLSDKPEKIEAKIYQVTEKMFEKFPPKSGGK
jgi:Domain of unknown function (DUF4136)